jgi:predicted ABC-type ATPase
MSGVFYLLAGPNGAGKSSLYKAACAEGLIPTEAEFVNADLHERDHLQHIADLQKRSVAARDWADSRRAQLLQAGVSFVSETVFSHPSKIDLIAEAQALGYRVVLLMVCVDDPQILLARVCQRVSEGGHDVPAQRILDRYPRTLQNLKQAIKLADLAMLFHNPNIGKGLPEAPQRVAVCRKGVIKQRVDDLPAWGRQVLGLD